MSKNMITRHTRIGIFMHWFNAVCWFFLLLTGVGLIQNPHLQPLGAWYPEMMRSLFGGGDALLTGHLFIGGIWVYGWIMFIVAGLTKYIMPFVIQIATYKVDRDAQWMIKKNIQMLLGYKVMARLVKPLGWDGNIPDQEYYNAGQKAAAVAMILGALVILGTGIIMVMSKLTLTAADAPLVQWSITLHYIAAGVTFAVLLVHIYMAAISKEERPAFFSMFTGKVPEEYAEHHHKIWYEKIKNER